MSMNATRLYDEWWTLIHQPVLFELPQRIGKLDKGTVLCGGMAKSAQHYAIEIYAGTDALKSWKYVSTVAMGGQGVMNTASAVWEPFFVCENGTLYCFYSDERGMTEGGQRIVYSKSTDGENWSEIVKVCDFEEKNAKYRPGMPVVTKLNDGRFMLIYEGVNMKPDYMPTYYKVTDDINSWDYTEHGRVMPKPFDGGSPCCITLSDGTIVAGVHNSSQVAINTDNLATNNWFFADTSITNAYSRCLFPLMNGEVLITSAGAYEAENPHVLERVK